MKRFLPFVLAGAFLLLAMTSKAQSNNLKLDLTALGVTEFRLNYEYAIDDSKSVVVMAGMMIPHKIPTFIYSTSSIENQYGGSVDIVNSLKGYTFGGQFRFYVGDYNIPNGFYVAPYLKYHKYTITTPILYEDNISQSQYDDLNEGERSHAVALGDGTYDFSVYGTITGSVSRFGGGVALGYQWLIGDALTIDWTFFGLGIERLNFGVEIQDESENYNPDYQGWADEINTEAEEFFLIGNKLDVEVESDRINVSIPVTVPMPYTSISIGYAF